MNDAGGRGRPDEEDSCQAVKPDVSVQVVALEFHKLAGIFDVDSAPMRVPTIQHLNGAPPPVGFVRGGLYVGFMKPIDEYCAAGA